MFLCKCWRIPKSQDENCGMRMGRTSFKYIRILTDKTTEQAASEAGVPSGFFSRGRQFVVFFFLFVSLFSAWGEGIAKKTKRHEEEKSKKKEDRTTWVLASLTNEFSNLTNMILMSQDHPGPSVATMQHFVLTDSSGW